MTYTQTENNNAFLMHISAYASYIFPLGGIIAPLLFWQIKKAESDYLDKIGKDIINFNLSFALYSFIFGLGFISSFFFNDIFPFATFSGISMVAIIAILRFILILNAALKTSRNENYYYPLTITFLK